MTNYRGSINTIYILPIKKVTFIFQNSNDNNFSIEEIEAESSYSVSSIERNTSFGVNIIIGFKVDASIFIPHNYYQTNDLIDNLMFFANKARVYQNGDDEHYHITIFTGDTAINSNGRQSILLCNLNGNIGITWQVESVEFRPRLILKITANFKDFSYLFGA